MKVSDGSAGKESTSSAGDTEDPWVRKIPWWRKWQPTPVFLPGKSHGQRSLAGYSAKGCKESDTTEHTCQWPLISDISLLSGSPGGSDRKQTACKGGDQGSTPRLGRSPEEGNTHSSILAWKIPWTEEPGRLQTVGSQGIGHN